MQMTLGEILALAFLLIVAGGLVFAGFYAMYGKPATAEAKERKQHAVNGFVRVAESFSGLCSWAPSSRLSEWASLARSWNRLL
jgi:hypothetical protein